MEATQNPSLSKAPVLARLASLAAVLALLAPLAAPRALAQTDADRKVMEKARALYSTGPIPGSISCSATLDWEGFFERMKIEQTDKVKAQIAKLSALKITITSHDADHTIVTIDPDDPSSTTLSNGLRQQLQGFFQMFWSLGYGALMGKPGEKFELTPTPDGYTEKCDAGPKSVSVDMDKSYLITGFGIHSEQLNASVKPGFKPGSDGLLQLRTIDETVDMGPSKLVIAVSFDYQKVDGYDIPAHLTMAMPGSYSFDYTLTSCQVTAAQPHKDATK